MAFLVLPHERKTGQQCFPQIQGAVGQLAGQSTMSTCKPEAPRIFSSQIWGGGNSKTFYFNRGNDPFWLLHVFQMGWFNHQVAIFADPWASGSNGTWSLTQQWKMMNKSMTDPWNTSYFRVDSVNMVIFVHCYVKLLGRLFHRYPNSDVFFFPKDEFEVSVHLPWE